MADDTNIGLKYDYAWISAPASRWELWQAAMHIRISNQSLSHAIQAVIAGNRDEAIKGLEGHAEQNAELAKFLEELLRETPAGDAK